MRSWTRRLLRRPTKRVLILTNSADLHADLTIPKLSALGCRPFRLDLDCFPRDYQLSQFFFPPGIDGEIRHLPSGERLLLGEIGAVWNRKPGEFSFRSDDLSAQELSYAKQESEHALFGLLYSLDCYWMSHPLALRGAAWKAEQLQRAMRMGFRIPASLITNAPENVRQFKQAIPGDMVFKSMSDPSLAAHDVREDERIASGLATTLVDEAMMSCLDAVAETLCHFQEYIAKAYELRVTVIGERVFAAKIHSQDDERTRVDSRDMSADIRYEAMELPPDLRQRCLDYVHSYGLNYGALDLIITPKDERRAIVRVTPSILFALVSVQPFC